MTRPGTGGTEAGPGHLLCIGLGYTARALADRLEAKGFGVTGTARQPEAAAAIAATGRQGLVFDGKTATPALAAAIGAATHILVSVPPDATGDPVLAVLGGHLAQARSVAWIGYLSTIGVYGDQGGGWVDETTPPAPSSPRSRQRLDAEAAWSALAAQTGHRLEIFRLPGIHGPGRSAIDKVRAGTARRIVRPGQVFNRMHVADIAAALEAALMEPPRFALYNLADDEPAPADEVVAYAARLLGVPPPPEVAFADAGLSAMARSFYGETKRVSNRRMKEALGVRLAYPTYREGLAAIAREIVKF